MARDPRVEPRAGDKICLPVFSLKFDVTVTFVSEDEIFYRMTGQYGEQETTPRRYRETAATATIIHAEGE